MGNDFGFRRRSSMLRSSSTCAQMVDYPLQCTFLVLIATGRVDENFDDILVDILVNIYVGDT